MSLITAGCSDVEIAIPNETSAVRYELRWVEGGLRFDEFELVLLYEQFSVPLLWENLPHNYSGLYNGCYRFEWEEEGGAIMFSFINWLENNGSLSIDMNASEDDDWTMVLTNLDGGRIEAEMTGTGGDGVQRRIAFSGGAPKPDDGELCTSNLVSTKLKGGEFAP